MILLIWYAIIVIAGSFASYFLGLGVEHYWPQKKTLSLVVFLGSFFLVLWCGWALAVAITELKIKRPAA